MKVFLIHGIFDDGRLFEKMSEYLNDLGITTIIPSLKPADARHGIKDLACKLKSFINENTDENEQFNIIGFSMGCLVSRVYLQELGGAIRCQNFQISLLNLKTHLQSIEQSIQYLLIPHA